MFQVTQEIEFCYGHRLLNYAGKCRHLHGHNGRILITLEATELDDRGMLVDFSDIKKSIRTWVDDELDHRMILNEADPMVPIFRQHNEPLFLIPHNPTAENIARLIFLETQTRGFPVVEVCLWETPHSFAKYRV